MDLPGWVDFVLAERESSAVLRKMDNVVGNWSSSIAIAQACMAFYQDLEEEEVHTLTDEKLAAPLIAASRVLDSASQKLIGLPSEHQLSLAITAAVCYGMHANFLSASATLDRHFSTAVRLSSEMQVVLALCLPNRIQEIFTAKVSCPLCKTFITLLRSFLKTGEMALAEELKQVFSEILLHCGTSFEGALLRSCRLNLIHLTKLSTMVVLAPFKEEFGEKYLQTLVRQGVKLLLPPQADVIEKTALLKSRSTNQNALISLPTSTGKTLLGEMCLVKALKNERGLVCFVAPYKTLARQVYRSVLRHVPKDIRVHRLTGSFRTDESLDPLKYKEFVIATPERFDALLRTRPQLLESLRGVVFDESHLIHNGTRGVRLEGLVARLLLKQEAGLCARVILLSAVISDHKELASWLKLSDEDKYIGSWTPTARRLAVWQEPGSLCWFVGTDAVRKKGTRDDSMIGQRRLSWPNAIYAKATEYAVINKQIARMHENTTTLVEKLLNEYGEPILCVLATKAGTRALARALSAKLPVLELPPEGILKAIGLIESKYSFLKSSVDLYRRGICFHNSTIPQDLRDLLEIGIEKKEFAVTCSTTTLAEGADLPFRFTILVDWLTWQGKSEPEPIPNLLFRNVAGRSGRAGAFTEGDTIIVDNPVGNPKYSKSRNDRQDIQMNNYLRSEPILFSALQTSDLQTADDIEAALASQFVASIQENSNIEGIDRVFTQRLFAVESSKTEHSPVRSLMDKISSSVLDESEEAIARVASPMRLTKFGIAVNKTGFSPIGARQIRNASKRITNGDKFDGLVELLTETVHLAEQPNQDIKKERVKKSSKFPVRISDFHLIISSWLQGKAYEDIFLKLPFVLNSKTDVPVESWKNGEMQSTTWDERFDDFVEFMSNTIQGFLPWVCRACATFAQSDENLEGAERYLSWALELEAGVENGWAAEILTHSHTTFERNFLNALGTIWEPHLFSEKDRLGVRKLRQSGELRNILIEEALQNGFQNQIDEVIAVLLWLQKQRGPLLD